MSETKPTNLYTALLSAQRDFSAVVKNRQNPHLKNFYADLGAVLDAVIEPLANHGLLILQRFSGDHVSPALITELVHAESGQSITSTLPIICKDQSDPQKLGGAITYARRYSLLALLGLAPEDDDGHSASQPAPRRDQQPAPRPAPAPRPTPAAQPVALPAPALAPDDPLAEVVAKLRAMETQGKPWDDIRKYADEQWDLADDYGREIINNTARAIKARRKAVQPPASIAG